MQVIETDYLVVGAGASGLAFTDALINESDVDVVMQSLIGGHTTCNAALIGYIESTARNDVEKNRLTPPVKVAPALTLTAVSKNSCRSHA